MKIVIAGGTGLVGRLVVPILESRGHEVVIIARSQEVDLVTGKGLQEIVSGTDVIVDLSNSASPDDATALAFFEAAGNNLVHAAKSAAVKHHLVLSIVGLEKSPHIGYLQAKKMQEDLVKASGLPYSIIRSTQFHEHISTIVSVQSKGKEVFVSGVDYQPVALNEVADFIASKAEGEPLNGTVDIAGPERAPMSDFVQTYLSYTGNELTLHPTDDNQYMFFTLPKNGLVPDGDFVEGHVLFEDWLKRPGK